MTDSALLYQTLPQGQTTFGGHPRALRTLFLTEMWERFSYYGMRAILMLYMVAPEANGGLGFTVLKAAGVYGWYTSLVYLTALPGGYLADTILGQRSAVILGGMVIALGHFCLAFPSLNSFYGGLAQGLTVPHALTAARQSLVKDPRYRHPYYWAAYYASGSGSSTVSQVAPPAN